ncbi:MAG: hypothetical protein ABI685_02025 [Ferruginibacter sp.]
MRKKKWKSFFLSFITIAIIAAGIAAYLLWNKVHKNVKDATAVETTAVDMYKLFLTDSSKAKIQFTDKVVSVSGELTKVTNNQQSQQVVLIKTATDGGYVNCTIEGDSISVKAGEPITIKGICSGYIAGDADMGLPGDVFLIRGYLIKQ